MKPRSFEDSHLVFNTKDRFIDTIGDIWEWLGLLAGSHPTLSDGRGRDESHDENR